MPERSFGRTVRYRRTKLGLSQAQLGELVGRSSATIRSWEGDKTRPTDPKVLSTLAAILGLSERQLFDKADVERPQHEESSPTVEQALATLRPAATERLEFDQPEPDQAEEPASEDSIPAASADLEAGEEGGKDEQPTPQPEATVRQLVGSPAQPAYVAPPDPYVRTPPTPNLADLSYIEDASQRQLYRVRTLATLVGLVALVVAFIWALQEGLGALDAWWDNFFGNLRL